MNNPLRSSLALAAACGLLFSTVVPAFAGPKNYQITGTVTAMDDTTLTIVTRTKDTWAIGRDATTKLPDGVKVGDKVKVNYTMLAGVVEPPDAATAKDKKAAPAKADKKAKADAAQPAASGSPSKPAAEAAPTATP